MKTIAIVGGGPTALYALQALVDQARPVRVSIFERSASLGRGTPYDPELNHPELLANIASFELPSVGQTLAQWLRALPAALRRRYGVGEGEIGERAFYPRVALGAYFVAAFRALVERARAAGHEVVLHRATRVVDVEGGAEGAKLSYRVPGGGIERESFDYVVVATGHGGAAAKRDPLTAPAYPPPPTPGDRPLRLAILGASLTAIDVAMTFALRRGEFVAAPAGLEYRLHAGAAPLRIEMRSRRGVLPEADFYFPYPYEPLRFCGVEALKALARADAAQRLDLAFDLLRAELQAQAPAFAAKIGLSGLNADTFAHAYFHLRGGGDPFLAARRNLKEARESARRRRPSAWRYTLLRAHEAFGELAPHLGPADAARFRAGLQRVFIDNYAAVPPLSVERLLALRAAGALSLRKLAPGYRLRAAEPGGVEIVEGEAATRYDFVVEARGQTPAAARDLPFPTLRLQILANQMMRGADPASAAEIEVDEHLSLARGANPVDRIYCLAAPFLLNRRPFIQGLTSARDLARQAVAHIAARADGGEIDAAASLTGGALYLRPDLIVATVNGAARTGDRNNLLKAAEQIPI